LKIKKSESQNVTASCLPFQNISYLSEYSRWQKKDKYRQKEFTKQS